MLNFHEFLHTMYKCMLNSVVKISVIFAKYFEYYIIILRGAVFSWTRCITVLRPFVRDFPGEPVPEETSSPIYVLDNLFGQPLSKSSLVYRWSGG